MRQFFPLLVLSIAVFVGCDSSTPTSIEEDEPEPTVGDTSAPAAPNNSGATGGFYRVDVSWDESDSSKEDAFALNDELVGDLGL
jgi:hypothetical protein